MPKQKSSAQIHVADGAGGMRPVADLRFEAGEWPIELIIPGKNAETWMAHLRAEMEERGWNSGGLSQIDSVENSGTLSVHSASGPNPPTLHIVWERPRNADLRVRARPDGNPTLSLDLAREFLDATKERVRKQITARAHRRDLLTYDGLPWRGELWLGDDLRLGPPSQFPDALLGSQIVVVDAMAEGIGFHGITKNFQTRMLELRIFLGMVLGIYAMPVRTEYGWVPTFDEQGRATACTLQSIGYWETDPASAFPVRGSSPPVKREAVERPGLGRSGIWPDMLERWVPADIEDLWRTFEALPTAKREHLLRAGNAYQIASSMWPDQRTAYTAFLVVACEALKPMGKRYDRMNVYDVVASLVSVSEAQGLRELSFHPQRVRSQHLHRGTLSAGELLPMFIHDDFKDPSFDQMLWALSPICRVCLIEWLRCKGEYDVIRLPRHKHGVTSEILEFITRILRRMRVVR
jgi:hypothetical protein